ncbi:MAG TPA: hypothetical protein VK698_30840 [Kofleriaceae bacterium]|nr:hypothetical protein [Kofleriaceae bacterium]
MRPGLAILVLQLGAASAAGCDTQASDDYRGEPMVRLDGTLTSTIEDPPATLLPVLAWSNVVDPGGDYTIAEQAIVTLEFPAQFHMEIFQPPGPRALNDFTQGGQRPDEIHVGVAHIVAWPDDMLPGPQVRADDDDDDDGPDVFGVAEHQLLIYVEGDVAPGTFSAELLGGELEPGFHVMDVVTRGEGDCPADGFDCLHLAPDDLDSAIQIRIDHAELLDFPDWS